MNGTPGRRALGCAAISAVMAVGAGCASQIPVPALLDPEALEGSQPATTNALNAAATTLMNGRRITLGSTAFVERSRVSLEHSMRNTPMGKLATGRVLRVPEELRLERVGRRCELVHSQSTERVALPNVACIEEPAPKSQ